MRAGPLRRQERPLEVQPDDQRQAVALAETAAAATADGSAYASGADDTNVGWNATTPVPASAALARR